MTRQVIAETARHYPIHATYNICGYLAPLCWILISMESLLSNLVFVLPAQYQLNHTLRGPTLGLTELHD
jgi:hypothetical protein